MDEKELWNKYGSLQKGDTFCFGPYYSFQFRNTPRHILFTLSRYKFAMKLIGENKRILELGCNEGLGSHYLSEFAEYVLGVDFDENALEWAAKFMASDKLNFLQDNFLGKDYGEYDAVVSYDVIEHIYNDNEDLYMKTVIKNLKENGICIIGTPNVECEKYANPEIAGAHVNLYTGDGLKNMLGKYFKNVFLFSQSDEIIHTGFYKTANYLICLCCCKY